MINAPQLLTDLKRRLIGLEDDLRARISTLPDLKSSLGTEWQAARDANRTAETFESWSDQVITQAGVHWLLSCVFLRFIEDNSLVDRPWIGGTPDSGRLLLAKDRHEAYFREHPLESDREYLLACFTEAGTLPGLHTFFDQTHNPVFRLGISGDAAMGLRQFWQQQDPNTGALLHDFTDPTWNTRFLGDLYQDLSEATRKRYALLQTPEFVEEFILDRTLTPALREYGYQVVRMIDPTCGSGHFLLGSFYRMADEWSRAEPNRNRRDVAQKALDAVSGVDLNPFAVAISRFRLLVAALNTCDVHRLVDAPDFKINVAIGDSLLHGKRFGLTASEDMFQSAEDFSGTGLEHSYASEDLQDVQRLLSRQYHTVVGNPPYIVVRDPALNAAYRRQYVSCHRQYSLGAPFTERFFELALTGLEGKQAGFVGLITANSFMKREFGSKLIEQVLPRLDLTHVVDTSGAFIPGHGTPTVIIFGRHRSPISETIRTVMGIKGEPRTPEVPANGLVWSAILNQVDIAGSESDFVSVTDTNRTIFSKHPWSIGGGGAGDVLELICDGTNGTLGDLTRVIGRTTHTGEDNVFFVPSHWATQRDLSRFVVPLIEGESVRDFTLANDIEVIFPYDKQSGKVIPQNQLPIKLDRHFWTFRTVLKERSDFGNHIEDRGLLWYEHSMFFPERYLSALGIAFAEVATHNHFALDRGEKVFKQTAPVIKLPSGSSEEDFLGLLGLLNSSIACFWMKQVSHQKQMMGGDGIRISEKSKVPYQYASTQLKDFPLPPEWRNSSLYSKLVNLARVADTLATSTLQPSAVEIIQRGLDQNASIPSLWNSVQAERRLARTKLILIQEEIDFLCYQIYGLTSDLRLLSETLDWNVELDAGCRPFCIVSQKNADGFEVPHQIPPDWPDDLSRLWALRINEIKSNPLLKTVEESHYKRRWIGRQGLFNHDARADEFRNALRLWLLNHLDLPRYWVEGSQATPHLLSTSQLANMACRDPSFQQISALYAGHQDFDPVQLVTDLVIGETVPFLPVLRYSETGLRKWSQWENVWSLQRRADSGESVGEVPIPPKYKSTDFIKTEFWRQRGGMDFAKERWISYPRCERGADGSLVIAWAGWDHLQQATALATFYLDVKENEGWPPERLQPLLAGLLELVPWLEQWHNDVDPVFGERMGHYYKGFVSEEARAQGFTLDDLKAWKPVVVAATRGRRKATA